MLDSRIRFKKTSLQRTGRDSLGAGPSSGAPLRLLSLVMAEAAIVGLFVEIPILSSYAFWIMVAAYVLWVVISSPPKNKKGPKLQS
jgi:hypothetical protein